MNYVHISVCVNSRISTSLDIYGEKITYVPDEIADDRIIYATSVNHEQKAKKALLG
jgi:hypothetical protein